MPIPTSPEEALADAFVNHSCVIAPILGAVAVGSALVGNEPFAALLLPAVGIQTARCLLQPYKADKGPGYGIPLLGGQCPKGYNIIATWTRYTDSSGSTGQSDLSRNGILGPISVRERSFRFGLQSTSQAGRLLVTDGTGAAVIDITDGFGIVPGTFVFQYIPYPNNPDNCGSQPPIYIPDPPGNPLPPIVRDPDGNPILPPYNTPTPYQPDPNKPPVYLPIIIPQLILKPTLSFPLSFPINIGTLQVGTVNLSIDGTFTIETSKPSTSAEQKDYSKILEEIKACACPRPMPPVCSYDLVDIPFLDTTDSASPCKPATFKLSIEPGGLSSRNSERLQSTVAAAIVGCASVKPEQKQEVLIATGTVPDNPVEAFTPPIGPEIVSVRIRILNIPLTAPRVSSFPAANQYKFGSAAFSLLPARAGGDYVYLFDQDTYLPLPRRGKDGTIRLLLRGGTSWEVYDTGERL